MEGRKEDNVFQDIKGEGGKEKEKRKRDILKTEVREKDREKGNR